MMDVKVWKPKKEEVPAIEAIDAKTLAQLKEEIVITPMATVRVVSRPPEERRKKIDEIRITIQDY